MGQVVTMQKTAKGIKLAQVVCLALFVVGVVKLISVGSSSTMPTGGLALTVAGAMGYVVTRIVAWWRHG